jgi:hypothetical protein
MLVPTPTITKMGLTTTVIVHLGVTCPGSFALLRVTHQGNTETGYYFQERYRVLPQAGPLQGQGLTERSIG